MSGDRTDHYVPDTVDGGEVRPLSPADATDRVFVEEYLPGVGRTLVERHIAFGLADELNRDRKRWWWADYGDTTEDGGAHWSRFEGHRILVDIAVRQANERHVNDWKGRDEIRGRTWAKVTFNGLPVWESTARSVPALLLNLHREVQELLDLMPLRWHVSNIGHGAAEREARFGLIGRPVYYRDHPGRIVRFIGEQGCVIIEPEPGPWPPVPWRHNEDEFERAESVKDIILSPHIWWWRDE